jgi:dTDP-4-amino-4,6-dideoxygalactose transaminase
VDEVKTIIHNPIPSQKQFFYMNFEILQLPFPEQFHNEVLTLPISPVISIEEAEKITKVLNSWN